MNLSRHVYIKYGPELHGVQREMLLEIPFPSASLSSPSLQHLWSSVMQQAQPCRQMFWITPCWLQLDVGWGLGLQPHKAHPDEISTVLPTQTGLSTAPPGRDL